MAAAPLKPDASFDGGDLDCGNGLLLLIRKHIDPLEPGQLLEVTSRDSSVREDLPAWCRLTKNDLVSITPDGVASRYLISKGPRTTAVTPEPLREPVPRSAVSLHGTASSIPRLAVMGIGSWPRPLWMRKALQAFLEGKISEEEFQSTADDAVRLAVQAQLEAGVDVITDGEQRRDNYASFVAGRLENTQLVPLTDLLPLVEDPKKFEEELAALDIPADQVRHPGVFGKLVRSRPLARHELTFVQQLTEKPIKIALPGPYLLTRTMWIDCISDTVYKSREEIATDIVRVLREEIAYLLQSGASLVQLDEPVLTEVVFSPAKQRRSFMCGALSEKKDPAVELAFASELLNAVVSGFPSDKLAVHVCRGNWTPDESVALQGSYDPLIETLNSFHVGTLLLEFCTARAGSLDCLKLLRDDLRIGVGSVNQKHASIESVQTVVDRSREAIALVGPDRLFLTPDCGFATFADNPLSSADVAKQKLAVLAEAARILRQ